MRISYNSTKPIALLFLLLGCYFYSMLSYSGQLSLNGIASYSELRKEYYTAALYLQQPQANSEGVLKSNQAKQMKLLVTAKRWSPRLWTQQWQNNIAINNDVIEGNKRLQKDLDLFTRFLKGNLIAGDLIVINYVPDNGSEIFINNELILATKGMKLFNYLMATWIGKLPPTRDFKNRILSLSTDASTNIAIEKFDNHRVPAERQQKIKYWLDMSNQVAKKQLELKESQKNQKSQKSQYQAKLKAQKLAKKKLKSEQVFQQKLIDKEKVARELAAKKKRQARELAIKKQRAKRLKLAKLNKEKEAQQQQYYLKDFYEWQLRQAIRKTIKYPAWAKQFNQEGIVDAQFNVNALGKISGVKIQENSAPKMLVAEVNTAIGKISGKIRPPAKLKGKNWTFGLTHKFDLKSKQQTLLLPPVNPAQSASLTDAENSKALGLYMDIIRGKITKAIKYPSEAVLLRKQGDVALYVTIDKQGKVLKVFERFKAKHKVLKLAMERAINKAKPFPAIPKELAKDSLTIDVEHRFKL